MNRVRSRIQVRHGSLIIEAIIALLLLTTAYVALGRLASSSARLQRSADHRVAMTLAAENVLDRLMTVPVDQIDQQAVGLAAAEGKRSGCQIQVETRQFQTRRHSGIQITVISRIPDTAAAYVHGWRFQKPQVSASEDSDDA